jgi:hypothetical protein
MRVFKILNSLLYYNFGILWKIREFLDEGVD